MEGTPSQNSKDRDLLALLLATPRPHRLVDFPRKDAQGRPMGQVAICPLTQGETMAAQASAEQKARKLLRAGKDGATIGKGEESRGYEDLYNNAAMNEILFRGVRKAEDPSQPLFATVQHIEQHLSTDETAILFNSYLRVQGECSPIVTDPGSEDEMEAWAVTLARVGNRAPLDGWSLEAAKKFAWYMVGRYATLLTSNSISGSPQDAGEDTSTSPKTDE